MADLRLSFEAIPAYTRLARSKRTVDGRPGKDEEVQMAPRIGNNDTSHDSASVGSMTAKTGQPRMLQQLAEQLANIAAGEGTHLSVGNIWGMRCCVSPLLLKPTTFGCPGLDISKLMTG